MTGLSHTLDSYAEMARRFLPGYAAHVSDVEAAFPMLPFAPWVWPFMLHRFYRGEGPGLSLFCHLNGDFGTRGMPGVFKIFFVDVVLNMARAAETLTIPMTVYVDDLAATGATAKGTTSRMAKFQDWAENVCGVQFKRINQRDQVYSAKLCIHTPRTRRGLLSTLYQVCRRPLMVAQPSRQ